MAKTTPEYEAALIDFIQYVREVLEAEFAVKYPHIDPDAIILTNGSKFTKIFKGGSVYAFVEKQTGLIYRPASRNAPAKEARGCIYSYLTWTCAGPYGIAYIRGTGANIGGCYVNKQAMGDLWCDKCKRCWFLHSNPCEGMTALKPC